MANSAAILTDAFPSDQRGLAMGINQIGMLAGSFVGLLLGGVLAVIDWRAVFLVSVPFGLVGTVWPTSCSTRRPRSAPTSAWTSPATSCSPSV